MLMRLAFLFDPRAVRNPVDPANIWTSNRGLTGSEIAFFKFATGLADMGHDVSIYTKFSNDGQIGKARCFGYEAWINGACTQNWDAAIANTIADPLSYANPQAFRFLNHQCNGFSTSTIGWESYVDMLAPLSSTHAVRLLPDTNFPKSKWKILHNGVDPKKFHPEPKEPGKIIWASSLDRGLHWLLELFPHIKREVPEANLHIFYDFHSIEYMAGLYAPGGHPNFNDHHFELGARSRYILYAIKQLEGKGVFAHRSVSRERIEQEMRTSVALLYPLDPVYFTETFGVVVLEACASGTVPVLCKDDAFGELWGSVSEGVPHPFKEFKQEFLKRSIHVLKDEEYRNKLASQCVDYAQQFNWNKLCSVLEICLSTRGDSGLPDVNWSVES
jgi:glycosyltransferase involved in cell wall biosynthesis